MSYVFVFMVTVILLTRKLSILLDYWIINDLEISNVWMYVILMDWIDRLTLSSYFCSRMVGNS